MTWINQYRRRRNWIEGANWYKLDLDQLKFTFSLFSLGLKIGVVFRFRLKG
jgi:hypothetical protein